MHNYILAVGGTGARCLESIIYLAAMGLFRSDRKSLYVLMVDPSDQNNGNGKRTRELIEKYEQINLCKQPSEPRRRGIFKKRLSLSELFQVPINKRHQQPNDNFVEPNFERPFPYIWNNPNSPDRTFRGMLNYNQQEVLFKDFLNLFYKDGMDGDLDMHLNEGYQARTSVGAVALKLDLERTVNLVGAGLQELIASLRQDLQNGTPRVFIMGSIFGGTGAAAIPTLPAFFNNLDATLIGDNKEGLRFGCAMMTPYFSFPQDATKVGKRSSVDSAQHMIAAKAALLHYAHVPPGYQHVYVIGAKQLGLTAETYKKGGEEQKNNSHYVELVAALSALDFFGMKEIQAHTTEVHFSDDMVAMSQGLSTGKGVTWDTLPARTKKLQEEIKQRLVTFTTFAYFYNNFLYQHLTDPQDYGRAPWYLDNFQYSLDISSYAQSFDHLKTFCSSFLRWLHTIKQTGGDDVKYLFRWDGLLMENTEECNNYLDHLIDEDGMPPPKFLFYGYDRILKNLDSLTLGKPETTNAAGLLIYLLFQAIRDFCQDNYHWETT